MRAVIYARLSEDRERAESVSTQISYSTKLADRMGCDVAGVFKDEGRSGFTGEVRPGFEDMLKFLSRGDVQVLIARHHDRLTRNPDDFGRLMKICERSKIKISLTPAASWTCRQRAAGSTASWRPAGRGTNQRSGASE